MNNHPSAWLLKALVICALAVAVNFFVIVFRIHFQPPLFLGNVIFAAVTFALGPVAGIAAVVAARVLRVLVLDDWAPFVIVSVIEMLVIGVLRPKIQRESWAQEPVFSSNRIIVVAYTFGKLFLLYVCCVFAASISGGIIEILFYGIPSSSGSGSSAIRALVTGLEQIGVHPFAASILSRIEVNLADRFLVVFGGYGISLLFRKWLGTR